MGNNKPLLPTLAGTYELHNATYIYIIYIQQAKLNDNKYSFCKLTFFNKVDVKMHKHKDHLTNYKGIILGFMHIKEKTWRCFTTA